MFQLGKIDWINVLFVLIYIGSRGLFYICLCACVCV